MATNKQIKSNLLELPQMDELTTKAIRGGNSYEDWWDGNSALSFMMSGVTIYSGGGYSVSSFNYNEWLNERQNGDGYGDGYGDQGGGGGGFDWADDHVFHGLPGTQYDPTSPEATKVWGTLGYFTGGFLNITGVAVDITKVVDTLTDVQLTQLRSFGNSLAAAGAVVGAAALVVDVVEEGHFDANDALNAAGLGLGVAALAVSAPLAIGLGVAGLVISVYTQTGAGDDWVLFKW